MKSGASLFTTVIHIKKTKELGKHSHIIIYSCLLTTNYGKYLQINSMKSISITTQHKLTCNSNMDRPRKTPDIYIVSTQKPQLKQNISPVAPTPGMYLSTQKVFRHITECRSLMFSKPLLFFE